MCPCVITGKDGTCPCSQNHRYYNGETFESEPFEVPVTDTKLNEERFEF